MTNASSQCRAVILAGRRPGPDPLLQAMGVEHKALITVDGITLIERVTEALRGAGICFPIYVVCAPGFETACPEALKQMITSGDLQLVKAAGSPSASARRAIEAACPDGQPVLLTTGDHPLLTKQMVSDLLDQWTQGVDLLAGAVREVDYRTEFPEGPRTFYRFSDVALSGANLFYLHGPEADNVLAFWEHLEKNRKKPWAMVRALGVGTLIKFVRKRLTLEEALSRLSVRTQARIKIAFLQDPRAAIDVDKVDDVEVVSRLLTSADQT